MGRSATATTAGSGPEAGRAAPSKLPEPTLPKGGGAIHGMGERFAVEASTGGFSLTVPVPTSAGRGASTADLSLTYRPGGGNSPFGLGWHVGVPSIARKTSRGVPTYTDSDVFVLGGDDLVPLLRPDGSGGFAVYDEPATIDGVARRVRRFRPRTETGYTRVEQCRDPATGDVFWRTVSRDNVSMVFGRSPASRVHDPADPTATRRVAEWLLEEVCDDRGNVARYEYKAEDTTNVAPSVYERQRLAPAAPAPAGRYLKYVRYANATPGDGTSARVVVVFDYGEHDEAIAQTHPWSARPDPFSTYRAGFELRTWRLCRRIMVFHDFGADLGPGPLPRLVRTVELSHQLDPVDTMLTSIRQAGYDWSAGAYQRLALPPLDLTYTHGAPDTGARVAQVRAGPDGQRMRWLDLDGDGLPGLLSCRQGGWWYQRPAGDGRWDPARAVADLPVTARVPGAPQLVDVDGSGRLSTASSAPELAGTSVRLPDGSWSPWRPFPDAPVLDPAQPGLRSQDLDGDGLPDLVLSGPDQVAWYPSLGRDGHGPRTAVRTAAQEEAGARPPSADVAHAWFAADLSGDGLSDLVRIRNGSLDYWPNLGRGRFGTRVRMAGAPTFDHPDQFDPARIRLADLDGSGGCDLLYLGRHAVTAWTNRAGNSWAPGVEITALPPVRHLDDVQVVDLLGKGTPCLVWTTSDPAGDGVVARFLDLCVGPGRPRQLASFANNLGATTRVSYAASTGYALADRSAGTPWTTRMASPVQVVSRVDVIDQVSGAGHASIYRYRDGYVDPDEREFRGFGRVEVHDAERFPASPPGTPDVHQPPVRTVTWFHLGGHEVPPTGAFDGDPQAQILDGHVVADVEGGTEYRQAVRALAGRPVRIEVHGEDGGPDVPYTVTQHRMRVVRLQPARDGRPAAFRVDPFETLECWYERTADDPRTVHTLTLQTDDFGSVRSSVRVAYPRRVPEVPEQARPLLCWTLTDVANTDDATTHRLGVETATRGYDVTGLAVPVAGRYSPEALAAILPGLPDLSLEQVPNHVTGQRRLVEATRHEYWSDALTAPLPAGQVGNRALLRQTRRLAFTPGLVAQVYPPEVDAGVLTAEGGYEQIDGLWWAGDGVVRYDPLAFYQPSRWDSPFGNIETVSYDGYGLLVVATQASTAVPLNLNRATVHNDYRVLGPSEVVDPHGTIRSVRLDALGRVVAAWLTGADGSGDPPGLPGQVHAYGSNDWSDGTGPAWAQTDSREVAGDAGSGWQRQRMYTDGLGRIVMTKTQAEPGLATAPDGGGGTVVVDTSPDPRWVGSGRTVFNDKGFPVEQYEPYFSTVVDYESADALVKQGLTQVRGYDPLGRVVRIDYPDGTYDRHEVGAWREVTWDRNDTVLTSDWFAQRQGGGTPPAEARAAALAAAHANTPTTSLTDALGRVVRTRADNGPDGVYETVLHVGIQGEATAVDDALGRRTVTQVYDAMGRVLATDSIDAGRQVALPAVDGPPVRHWSALGFAVRCGYDALRRPTHLFVREPGAGAFRLAEYTVYGEEHPQAVDRFLVGRLHRRYDQAGLSQADRHDLDGHLVEGSRRVLAGTADPDWSALSGQPLAALDAIAAGLLDGETFVARTTFDAVGRPLTQQMPDGTVLSFGYGAGGLLDSISGQLAGQQAGTDFVTGVDYDAHRRRTRDALAAGVVTTFDYDQASSRLLRLTSMRGATPLQDLAYAYDPMGNVVQIDDTAQQVVFFAGAVVAPTRTFGYDPVYRLTAASGREHSSLGTQPDSVPPTMAGLPHPNDANALRTYTETYSYDAVGNLLGLAHATSGGGWTRRYDYQPGSNRLRAHSLPADPVNGPYTATFDHDAAGQMTRLPTLPGLTWDHAGRMHTVDLGGGGQATYQHDATGNRVRKIWARQGAMREERIYLGPFELFRRYLGDTLVFERRTVQVLDGKRTVALVETVTVDTANPGFDADPVLRYQLADHLGSSAVECDAGGQVLSYEEYHPFGTTAVWLARGAAAVSTKRYRYTGKENDEETGLYLNGTRHYAPWLGRWTSPDLRGIADGTNRYAYVNNNPVRLIDPDGMQGAPPDLWDKGVLPFWQGIQGEQLWLSEAKPFWAQARATAKGRGFTEGLYQYFRDVKSLWGGPEKYALGHQGKPFAFLEPGEDSWIAIQSVPSNAKQSVFERALAGKARELGIPVREADLFPGAQLGKHWGQPDVPTIEGIRPTFTGSIEPQQLPLGFGKAPVTQTGPLPEQLQLNFTPGTNATTVATDANAAAKAAPVAADTAAAAKVAPVASDVNAATKVAPAVADTNAATKVVPVATDATTVAKVAPAVNDATAVTKAAPALNEGSTVVNTVTTVTDTSAAAKVAPVVSDTAAAVNTDATLVKAAEQGTEVVKTLAPVAKEASPALKEAGALTKVMGAGSKVLKAAQPVIKVVGPVLRTAGEVAKPLGVVVATADLATANNNTDRLVAAGDLTAGVAMYCGPVGEAFGAGYTLGGLADQGIAKASKATLGVDLSPSNGIAQELNMADKLVSAVLPDSSDKPAYKQENKVAWFLIDTLGF